MKYFLIAGEASGDLHAAHLMRALRAMDVDAQFQYYGGDEMQAVGGTLLCHYKDLAYMGFISVALHLRTILKGMAACKEHIRRWHPDVVILVDYPGFNLSIAKTVHAEALCPVYYYISPKIWAWKENRIKRIKRDVDALFSILPFETTFFEKKHHYPITYVGNPTVDEVAAYTDVHGAARPDGHTLALLPGSRTTEVESNLGIMLQAAAPYLESGQLQAVIAAAPALPRELYERVIARSGVPRDRVQLASGETYGLLHRATAALVTSGTATLETALFRVPQVVCYHLRCGRFIRAVRPYFLKVPYISLVNLVADREVVPELVGSDMNVALLRRHLAAILPGGSARTQQLEDYAEVARRLGEPGAPRRAAEGIIRRLSAEPVVPQD